MNEYPTTKLPPVTPEDLRTRRMHLRQTPKGTWRWRCEQCNQYAVQVFGKRFFCRRHGLQSLYPEAAGTKERSRIEQRVREYQEQQLNPDNTDEDMYYLRVYLDERHANRPKLTPEEVALLQDLPARLSDLDARMASAVNSPEACVQIMHELVALGEEAKAATAALRRYVKYSDELFKGRLELIKLSLVRARTRALESEALQTLQFCVFLDNMMQIIAANCTEEYAEFIRQVLVRELKEVPRELFGPHTLPKQFY